MESDEGASPPHSGTAVHHHWPSIGGVAGGHFSHKVKQGGGLLWDTVIGPDGEVELPHDPLHLAALHLQGEGADSVGCQDQIFLDRDLH